MADVLIIGVGAAGLAAAQTLRRAGREVRVLEAAEGLFAAVGDLLSGFGDEVLLRDGVLGGGPPGADLSFAELLERPETAHVGAPAKRLARLLVEGFDAADPEEASSAALAHEWRGGTNQEDAQFRPAGGYGALLASLRRGVSVQLHTEVREVRWGPGEATVTAARFGEVEAFSARRVLVTLPLSLLQRGAVRFSPDPGKEGALAGLRMGSVVKAVLLFDTPFWRARFPQASFFSAPDAPFPTFWTSDPLGASLLSVWAGGPKAAALSGLGERELVRAALGSLRAFFGPVPAPAAVRVLDWQADPYARGAYSYVATGGLGARGAGRTGRGHPLLRR